MIFTELPVSSPPDEELVAFSVLQVISAPSYVRSVIVLAVEAIQWSPEEIEGRLQLEYGKTVISYQTIYRAIYRGHFDDNSLSHGADRKSTRLNSSH